MTHPFRRARELFESDPRWKAVPERDREELFHEAQRERDKREKEERRQVRGTWRTDGTSGRVCYSLILWRLYSTGNWIARRTHNGKLNHGCKVGAHGALQGCWLGLTCRRTYLPAVRRSASGAAALSGTCWRARGSRLGQSGARYDAKGRTALARHMHNRLLVWGN